MSSAKWQPLCFSLNLYLYLYLLGCIYGICICIWSDFCICDCNWNSEKKMYLYLYLMKRIWPQPCPLRTDDITQQQKSEPKPWAYFLICTVPHKSHAWNVCPSQSNIRIYTGVEPTFRHNLFIVLRIPALFFTTCPFHYNVVMSLENKEKY